MSQPKTRKPVDLKQIEATSPALERFVAALRREGKDPWNTRFAASGAKPPVPAPAPAKLRV